MPVRLLQVTALAAFFCASGAHASSSGSPGGSAAYDAFMGLVYGNSTTVGYGSDGTALATSSNNLGTPYTEPAGRVAVSTTGPSIAGEVKVPLGNTGKSATAKAVATFPKVAVARGLIKAAKLGAGGIGGIAAGLAAEALLDYGISKLGVGDDGSLSGEYNYSGEWWASQYGKYEGAVAACNDLIQRELPSSGYRRNAKYTGLTYTGGTTVAYCNVSLEIWDGYQWKPTTTQVGTINKSTSPGGGRTVYEQEIEDLIAQSQGWPTSSTRALAQMLPDPAVRDLLKQQGVNIDITGESSVKGKTSTTTESVKLLPGTNTVAPPGTAQTQPGTVTTTTTATHPVTYSGNKVTYTTINNTTQNITNNTTNVTTTETKTEEIKEDNKPDECEKRPNTIGCKEIDFDTPEGEIPRKQIDVTWSPVDLGLGGGSCPAPVQIYENKQFSYQLACDNLYIIKPMVIAIALFVGGMIIFGGRAEQ